MDQERFNREMEDYIRERRRLQDDPGDTGGYQRSSLWQDIKDFFAPDEPEMTHIDDIDDEEPDEELSTEEMEQLEEELDDVEEPEETEVEDLDVPEPSFLDQILSLFGAEESEFDEFDPDEYAEEESERVMFEEDVKEILQIANTWIEELPADKLREFKQSDDFSRYHELLQKLDLLKE